MSDRPGKLYCAVGRTHVGLRKHNEDTFLVDPELGLMIVADGVGGQHAGEIASQLTCDVMARDISAGIKLEQSILNANAEVAAAVEQGKGKEGMASTVVALHINDAEYELAWVGDSRGYLWDGTYLKLLTRDHSFVEILLEKGAITPEQALDHPQRHTIVQAIGLMSENELRVGGNRATLKPNQSLLLCSDGLSDVLPDKRLVEILTGDEPIEECCSRLVDAAFNAGGRDNITALLLTTQADFDCASMVEPEEVWSFDPSTGNYTTPAKYATQDKPVRPSPTIKRVAPRKATINETTMMSSDEIVAALNQKHKSKVSPVRRPLRPIVRRALSIGAVIVIALAYWIYQS